MADFPQLSQPYNRVIITPSSIESCGVDIKTFQCSAPAGAAWPSANLAIYIPFVIYQPFVAQKMFTLNGGTASGNVDLGIYDAQGDRLVSIGSTAQSGTSATQTFDITDTTLQPGVYYMAIAADGTTGTYWRYTNVGGAVAAQAWASAGCLQQASAFALPATATFAAMAQNYIPEIGILARTTV